MKLERGINLGGYLSQCVHSTEHYDAFIQEEDIRKIASMGFDHVRLAIDYEVLEDEYGRTREEGFAYVTRVVEWCKRQELNIVLDLHKAYGYDFNNAGDQKKNILFTNKMVQKRFVNLWIKIAEHYANETHVAFELLNEVVEQENAGSVESAHCGNGGRYSPNSQRHHYYIRRNSMEQCEDIEAVREAQG